MRGVFDQCFWAGLGVTLQNSARLKALLGVPKLKNACVPGVVIIEDGRGVALLGGVDGGAMTGDDLVTCIAGDGDAAR